MPIRQTSPFIERLLRFVIPYFTGVTADLNAARAEALETLAAYGARTRAELLCAVQIIVFSFAALDTLGESNTVSMSPAMRIRFRGCANNLNRSCQKTEHTLAKRLACDAPDAAAQQDPINDLPEPQVEEILQQTQARIDACRNPAAGNRSPHSPQSRPQAHAQQHRRHASTALLDSLAAELATQVQAPPQVQAPLQVQARPGASPSTAARTP